MIISLEASLKTLLESTPPLRLGGTDRFIHLLTTSITENGVCWEFLTTFWAVDHFDHYEARKAWEDISVGYNKYSFNQKLLNTI